MKIVSESSKLNSYPAIETDEYFNLEHQMKRKDGSTFLTDHTVTALLDDRGKRVGWTCTIRDITERKRAGDELRESELRLRILVEEAPVPISVSRNGIGLYANRKFLQMVGLTSVEESVGQPIADYFAPQSREQSKERTKNRSLRLPVPSEFDSVFLRRDGSQFPVHVAVEEVQLPNGKANIAFVTDITERKRMEEKLRESEQLYRTMAESSPDDVFILRRDTSVEYMNSSGLNHFGLTLEEVTGKMASDLFPPEVAKRVVVPILTVLQTGKPIHTENQAPFPGTVSWRDERWIPLKTGNETIAVLGITRDITERKRMEVEIKRYSEHLEELVNERTRNLKESEMRYKSLIENIPQKIFTKDRNSAYVSCNDNFAEDLKIKAEDIVGKTDYDFFPKDLADHYRADDKRIMETGLTEEIEEEYAVGGQKYWINTTKTPFRDAAGNITGLTGIFQDFTDRRLMIQQLRESEERYRSLFESSPISLWEEDFSDVKKYFDHARSRGVTDFRTYFMKHPEEVDKCSRLVKVISVNSATLELYGARTVRDFVDGLGQVLSKESLDTFGEELIALAEGKSRFESEFANQTLTGNTKHMSLILSVMQGYEDTLAKVVVSLVDLTEHKKMEKYMSDAQRLIAIGQTAAMVGHDLRNPLQAITTTVHLMRKQFESIPNDQKPVTKIGELDMLDTIEDSVYYMNKIVSDLQPAAEPRMLQLTQVNLSQLLNESDFPGADTPNIKVSVSVRERHFVLADPYHKEGFHQPSD